MLTSNLNDLMQKLYLDDYMQRRKILQEKLNELFSKDYEDTGTLAEEIQKLEQETIGEHTKSLVGRIRVRLTSEKPFLPFWIV